MTLQISKDLRPALGPVRDQGRRPTCLSFAASAVHEHARDDLDPLSVEWLYFHSAQRAGTGLADGTTLPDTRWALHKIGQPSEQAWPYCGQQPRSERWNAPAISTPVFRCGSNECDPATTRIRDELNDGNSVVVALYVSSAFTTASNWMRIGNEIILPNDKEPVDHSRGHAVVAVGYGRFENEAILLIRNSWGTAWGQQGHAWVYENYLTNRLIGAFTICEGDGDVLQSDADCKLARTRVG